MNFHLETKRLLLNLRSPVHVGTHRRQLTPMEAVPLGGRIYVIHEDRLAAFLAQHRLVDELVIAVNREGERFDLRSFLERKRLLTPAAVAGISAYSTAAPAGMNAAQLAAFRPLIRTGLGRAYIPGTSSKGAIRTALLNARIAAMDEAGQERVSQAVDGQIGRAKRERFAPDAVTGLLQGQLKLHPFRRMSGPNLDLLRCLKVSDAEHQGDTVVHPVQVLSLQRGDDRFYLKEPMLLECIPAGTQLTCTVTLDHGLLGEFRKGGSTVPFQGLDDLLAQVQAHANATLDEDHYFFKGLPGAEALFDFYNATDANLRVGLGSGLPSTTILLNLPKAQRFRLRDQVFRMQRDSQLFPKSRKVITRGREPVAPLGWIHLASAD